ncbi:MAG: pilus assembly protein TadG-related protein, partial [Ramlibacter sp.]
MQRLKQRGSIMVLAAGTILVLTSFAVLAVDIGRIMIVRNELQNVVDAAALAGANCLPRQVDPGSTVNCLAATSATLNWARASAKAQDTLSRNAAANTAISSTDSGHQIEVGYWNLQTQSPSGGSFSTTFTPTVNDKPAVRVTVRKDAGMNNGPVVMLTRLIFGRTTDVPIAARAVAVISSPSTVSAGGGLLPMVINKCMFDLYWNSTTNSPKLATATTLTYVDGSGKTQSIPQTIGQPWE